MANRVSSEPLNGASPSVVIDVLDNPVQMRVKVSGRVFGTPDNKITREELLFVESVDREQVSGLDSVFDGSILSEKGHLLTVIEIMEKWLNGP